MSEKKTTKKNPKGVSVKSESPATAPDIKTPAEEVKVEAPKTTKTASAKTLDVDMVAETKAILAKGEHTNFIIPMGDGEKPGAYETVQINGYKLTLQKGVMVNIPLPVANLLAEKYRIAMHAGEAKRIDRAPDMTEALT